MQLVAYGAQDVYLTGNPEITLFKSVYKRHTQFTMEVIELSFDGSPKFGQKTSVTIARSGDLLSKCYIKLSIKDNNSSYSLYDMLHNNGYAFIDYVELEIGGQIIDKQYGEWMNIWSELTLPYDKMKILQRMIDPSVHAPIANSDSTHIYIPLQFFFCKEYGAALPLIALQYHEVIVHVKFNDIKKVLRDSTYDTNDSCCPSVEMTNCVLSCEYIYLDVDERQQMANSNHEFLIEQVQADLHNSFPSNQTSVNFNLDFSHPVKEMVWVIQDLNSNNYSNTFNYWNNGVKQNNLKQTKGRTDYSKNSNTYYRETALLGNSKDQMKTAVLQLNGQDRFAEREAHYFRNVQRYQHHTGSSSIDIIEHNSKSADNGEPRIMGLQNHSGIYMYSFALEPEKHQPTGTCNFSRMDNVVFYLELEPHYTDVDETTSGTSGRSVHVYALNYNILRIMSGVAGLAYAN